VRKAGVVAVIVTTLVVGLAGSIPHLSEWAGSDRAVVVQMPPASIHPDDRHEESPEEARRVDRQKVSVATASIAVPQENTNPEPHVTKGTERVAVFDLPFKHPPFPSVRLPNAPLLVSIIFVVVVVSGLILFTRGRSYPEHRVKS